MAFTWFDEAYSTGTATPFRYTSDPARLVATLWVDGSSVNPKPEEGPKPVPERVMSSPGATRPADHDVPEADLSKDLLLTISTSAVGLKA
jgi:hypothetical protein